MSVQVIIKGFITILRTIDSVSWPTYHIRRMLQKVKICVLWLNDYVTDQCPCWTGPGATKTVTNWSLSLFLPSQIYLNNSLKIKVLHF